MSNLKRITMKKFLPFFVLAIIICNSGFSQELIQNGDFSLPSDGKKYSKVDSIPNWYTDATTADENGREFDNGNAVAWAWDEGASIYQVVGDVPSEETTYTVSLDATCTYSWWSDYVTDLYIIFSSFTGTDTTNRTVIDTVKFTVSCQGDDWGTYANLSDNYVLEAGNTHAGEHLVIEIKMFNSADFGYGSSYTYLHYDNVSVIATGESGINEMQSVGLKVFPVPVANTINLSCDIQIESVRFLTVTGVEAKNIVCENKNAVVDITDLSQGVYIVIVKTCNDLFITKKVVKE
jgi:hypothetical protein